MKPVEPPNPSLSGAHCCVCSTERGSLCGHIGGPFVCDRHATPTSGSPFVTPENPLGKWDLPFESVPLTEVDIRTLLVDSLDCSAVVADSPIGRLAGVIFDFHSTAMPSDHQPPRLTFLGIPDVIRNVGRLVSDACNGAADAAERAQ